ncbi:MAG TPA: HEPN domain-containing protein [Firmicutes bacterium]|nr:HEPN domain-containing protein [Bacillota bacterium]
MARRGERSGDSRRYHDWAEAAYEDLLCSKVLREDGRLLDGCAFHCQQCAEKSLKAYLLYKAHQRIDGHNLTWLCRQAIRYEPSFQEWLDESAKLNHYYIATRYPTDVPVDITPGDADVALRMAEAIFLYVCEEIGIRFAV